MRIIKFIRNLTNGECYVLAPHPLVSEVDSALKHLTLPIKDEKIHRVKGWDVFGKLLGLRATYKKLYRKKSGNSINAKDSSPQTFKSVASNKNVHTSRPQQLKDFIYNLCYFPDQAGPWIFPAYLKGKKLVKEQNIDIIFATGNPWSALLVGYLISKTIGKPLIADFRDPWINNPFHQSKGEFLDRWSKRLEKKVVEHALAVSLNTEPLMDDFIERFPHLPTNRFFVMPNGFDNADFKGLNLSSNSHDKNMITLCHTGFIYGVRDPAVLLDAIKVANIRLAPQNRKIRFQQIGDIQLAYDIRERYADMIADGSLALEPPRSYQECLCALGNADWVVNVQPGTKSQVPSKLYDYLALNRPILNITPKDGALGQLVIKYGLGKLSGFDEETQLSEALVDMALIQDESRKFDGYPARSKFDCTVIAAQLAQRIVQLTTHPKCKH